MNTTKKKGKLYLIPVPFAPEEMDYLPPIVRTTAVSLRHYFVERLRTARRFLKEMDKQINLDAIQFSEIGQHDVVDLPLLEKWVRAGEDVGVMSEAGCPGIADPGSLLVAHCHQIGAEVVPLPGPNSMVLALMGSGFSGQRYRFWGYLPVKQPARRQAIKQMERDSAKFDETQIFMETPYRNNQLVKEVLEICENETFLGVAADLNAHGQFVQSRSVKEWKRGFPDLHKRPVVFTIFAGKQKKAKIISN